MNTIPSTSGLPSWTHELDALRNHWRWFLALGIAMIVFGTIAIGSAVLATVAATVLFGFLLLAGGISTIISSFYAGRWSGMLLHLLIGVLYTVVGLMIINRPAASAIELTLIIAFFLIFGGIFRVDICSGRAVHRLGLGALERRGVAAVGPVGVQAMAGFRPVGDRPVRRHRIDLQRLGLDHAVVRLASDRFCSQTEHVDQLTEQRLCIYHEAAPEIGAAFLLRYAEAA